MNFNLKFVDCVVAEAEALSVEEFHRASKTLKPPTGEDLAGFIGVLPELLQKICALVILLKKKLEDLDGEIKKLGKAQSKVITEEIALLILERNALKSRIVEIEGFAWSVLEGEFGLPSLDQNLRICEEWELYHLHPHCVGCGRRHKEGKHSLKK
ncbi:hypothetical protein IT399_02795 [Candidatus Nomurabacteria bacterium]|nr:hypothetical protein [Candidatus Nomurabacteria bacterium]